MKTDGFVSAWKELNRRVAREMATDPECEIRQPRVIARTANPAKTKIGWMARRLLRGEFRKKLVK